MSECPAPGAPPPRVARCWTLVSADGALDVELTAADDDRVGAVLSALSRALGHPVDGLWSGPRRLSEEECVGAAELAHGAVLGLGRPVPDGLRDDRASALELHVVGGPDAGRTVPLGQGRHVLGRGDAATVALDDPDVSRRHVTLVVGRGQVTVSDASSTNGSRLDDARLGSEPRRWEPGELLRLGSSAVAVAGPASGAATLENATGGRRQLRPTPRLTAPAADVEIPFPEKPAAAPSRRLAWVAIAFPALGGVLMAWLLQTPTFLFFALLSPVVALGTWLSDRWTGRRSGRREAAAHAAELESAEKRLAAAVRTDVRAADRAQPDLAALATAARRRSRLLWSRAAGDTDALSVRVGSGPGPTGVIRIQAGGARQRATTEHAPVVVDLRVGGGLGIVGPRETAMGVLRSVVAQTAALHAPGEVEFLLLVGADRLAEWSWIRWLPHLDPAAVHVGGGRTAAGNGADDDALNAWLTSIAARRRATVSGAGSRSPSRPTWLVVVVDRHLPAKAAAILRGSRDTGVVTLATAASDGALPVSVDTALRITGETGAAAVLSRHGLPDRDGIVVDRFALPPAAALARDLGGLVPVTSAGRLPRTVRLLDLPVGGLTIDDSGGIAGTWSRTRDSLAATLGRSLEGAVEIDLCRQGPHALIAGTTGSGKSELLQTLIAGLALRHPPDRCSFLLVDYKGGAAFAEAAELPHTVGLVTDLDGQSTGRALRSLGAELSRREAILGAHQVSDIAALPEEVDLGRLVIVVDEFATLAEELPEFVPGLVSIAQRGRSLGIHLVLATQRPGGVVSPEIRANCTLRICLRTTDEADSRDVLGTPQAAHLPLDQPGRAYLRAGTGEPTLLQVARASTRPGPRSDAGPEIRRWTWPIPIGTGVDERAPDGSTDLVRLTRALTRHGSAAGLRTPHRPWRPPLPDRLLSTDLPRPADADSGARLSVGLVDLPDRQDQEALEVDLAEGGAWLAVGGPRSGRTTFLRTVLAEAVRRLGPDVLHVHVLDSGGGALAAAATGLSHTGTAVAGADALRTARLVDRLAREVADRRTAGGRIHPPKILLLVDGVEAVSTLLDDADPANGSATLLRLVRDGGAVGVTCLLTADRAAPGGRLASAARHRLVLPLADRADYAVAGIPARAVPARRPPGRALIGEEALECQLALPRPLPTAGPPTGALPRSALPLHIAELAPDPVLPLPRTGSRPAAGTGGLPLPVGPGGDEGEPVVTDVLRTGGLLITGPPGSGRSSALLAFAQHFRAAGTPVLWIGPAQPVAHDDGHPSPFARIDPDDLAGAARWVAEQAGRPCVAVADDVGAPAEMPALDALPGLGGRSGVALLAAGSAGQFAGHYQGPVAHLRRARAGLLLSPGPGDADLLGIRLPRTPLPVRPGSGWLAGGGRLERVQVARRRAAAGPR